MSVSEAAMRALREHLANSNSAKAIDFLRKQWAQELWVQSDEDKSGNLERFTARMGPLLAECFQPMPSRSHGCLLLEAAKRSISTTQAAIESLKKLVEKTRAACLDGEKLKSSPFLRSIELRAECVDLACYAGTSTPQQLKHRLGALWRDYRALWHTDVWSDISLDDKSRERRPAAFAALKGVRPEYADWLDDLLQRESPIGWFDPAATFLADSLLEAAGGQLDVRAQSAESSIGRTWVLIAVDDHLRTHPEPTGLLLELRVEAIPNGCGTFYPHPLHAAHIVPDRQFQKALRNAWQVALGQLTLADAARRYDYRWSLIVVDDSDEAKQDQAKQSGHRRRQLVMLQPLGGRSGEVALAAGLRSVVEQVPLDLSRAATAMFAEPLPRQRNPRLTTVLAVRQKSLGIAATRSHTLAQFGELVVATGQQVSVDLGRPKVEAADFDRAWQLLSHDSRITAEYQRAVLERTKDWFGQNCFGTAEQPTGSYILNALRRRKRDRGGSDDDGLLSETQRERLVQGYVALRKEDEERADAVDRPAAKDDARRRMKLVADSGIGKTSFLIYAAHQISLVAGPLVPIRIEHLSELLDRTGRDAWLDLAVDHVQTLFNGVDRKPEALKERRAVNQWLTRQAERGRIVWLLDALDQTSVRRDRMVSFVNAFSNCPIVLTMRPESESEFGTQTEDAATRWETLDLLAFSEDDARTYLGEYADLFFDRLPVADRRDEVEGHVLTIPLLLHLLREMAVRTGLDPQADPQSLSLPEFRNRYSIYEAVLTGSDGLIDHGWQRLQHREPEVTRTLGEWEDAQEFTQRLAFEPVRAHHFDTVLKGDLYRQIKRRLFESEKQLPKAVKQLNIVTQLPAFDDARRGGFKWRHRSFLEFFAGCQLAQLFADDETRQEAISVLRDVHEVLDEAGHFKQSLIRGAAGTIRNLPQDWHWTLRFALAHATEGEPRDRLAVWLIRLGNPWIVYEAIDRDGLDLASAVERLCRWLVHRDLTGERDFHKTWSQADPPPVEELTETGRSLAKWGEGGAAALLSDLLLNRSTRDAAYFDPLLELLESAINASTDADLQSACQDALSTYRAEAESLASEALTAYQERFVAIPAGTFDPRRFHKDDELPAAGANGPVEIPDGLTMADFPVTNAVFEACCPTHRRSRDHVSSDDDQPVHHVSFFMAQRFAEWLSRNGDGRRYRLPSEWEWEYACRGGSTTEYWWGDEMRDELCWYFDTSGGKTRSETAGRKTRSRPAALAAYEAANDSHPYGLLDVHGNVWEWCDSLYRAASAGRVVRGGAWLSTAGRCRSASRYRGDPDLRNDDVGFRLCCRAVGVSPESSSSR